MKTQELIAECAAPGTLWPMGAGRLLGSLKVAGRLLRDWQEDTWRSAGAPEDAGQEPQAWIAADDLHAMLSFEGPVALVDARGCAMAWRGGEGARRRELVAGKESFWLRHPWDILRLNEQLVGCLQESRICGHMHPAAHLDGVLVLGEGSRVLPGVFIEGKVIIGKNCKIGPNCYIRGNSAIGDGCHIGQAVEIKNSLIGDNTNVGHLSYVGDSLLGDRVNFGAGTIVSNLRHDGANHRSVVGGVVMDTGRRKFGTAAGDGVHTGIHTAIYPGRKLGPGATTLPGAVVDRDVPGT